ncbi:ABC transporter substrate-binding protein [Jiangella mangrovi]|uniref:Branched-chain amino acid transport system substrate-binding protein n=1 Tax=Jiangella mangrovi TaxID=1524084 RepID=A0A7W9GLL8_9ACTN|nr:ABC transporter substrate-binding protein [Jiangella mangrovi]MBB5785956.1 branched-chain amino acid transport system substrate-binding protein [Jiangella mangrovi]
MARVFGAPADATRWACVDDRDVLSSAPRGWPDADPALLTYVHAAAAAGEPAAFLWSGGPGRVVAVGVTPVWSAGPRPVAEVTTEAAPAPYGLTWRELQVLTLVAGGLTNTEIAARLRTARRTVATHVERLLTKLEVPTRTAAASTAVDARLLVLPIPGGAGGLAAIGVQRLEAAVSRRTTAPARPGPRPVRKHPIVIGGVYPAEGRLSADGQGRRRAAELAVGEVNAHGGVDGHELVHVAVEADLADLTSLAGGIDDLVGRGVDAVTLGYTLARHDFAGVFASAADHGCPVLHSATSQSAQSLVLEEPVRFGNVFQVCAPESRYGVGFVRALRDFEASGSWRPHRRELLVVDSTDPHLTTFTAQAHEAAERAGWRVEVERVDFLRPGWRQVLDVIGQRDPAAVMVATWVEPSLLDFLRRFRATGSQALVYAIYAPSVPGFLERAGALAEGLSWATVIGTYQDGLAGRFAHEFAGAHHSDPGRSGAGIHYDMVHLLTQAWRQVANPHDTAAVNQQLRTLVYRGVSGAYWFGSPGQSALTYPDDTADPSIAQAHLVHQVQDGRHVIVAPSPYAQGTFRPPPLSSTGPPGAAAR